MLCIGAGKVRMHYHAYLKAASRDDAHARSAMASELTMIHGVPPDCDEREFLRELQNALLWINFRYYRRRCSGLWWGPVGPVLLMGYAFLRSADWLARYLTPHERLLSGIDAILHVLDWLPVRLVGVVYALIGHGEKRSRRGSRRLATVIPRSTGADTPAQFSLAREPHTDKIETPKAAVSMAKNVVCGGRYRSVANHLRHAGLNPRAVAVTAYRQAGCQNQASVFVPADELQAGMTIGVIKRIAFNFGVISRVIHQHIFSFRRLRKAVMARPYWRFS